jgi:pre-mRNA-splicing helicase BRR2
MSAADEVLAILKNEEMKPADRQKEVELLLKTQMSPEVFADLIKISKAITDFVDETGAEGTGGDEAPISIVFGDETQQNETFVVPEEEDEMEDEETTGQEAEVTEPLKETKPEEKTADKLTLDPQQIDAYWLQRELSKIFKDPLEAQRVAGKVLGILAKNSDSRECENDLFYALDFSNHDVVKLLLHNRWTIVYCTRLGQAQSDEERKRLEEEMLKEPVYAEVAEKLKGKKNLPETSSFQRQVQKEVASLTAQTQQQQQQQQQQAATTSAKMQTERTATTGGTSVSAELFSAESRPANLLDLDALAFAQGAHFMSNKQCKLPAGSFRQSKKGYEEVHVPALKPPPFEENEHLIPISSLPDWAQPAFEGIKELNRIQSRLYKAAFEGADNILLCAPTGAGKTNVAMLAMLHEIGLNMDKTTKKVNLDAFKIIYIAPMKSLVQEMVHNFGTRLKSYGITVRELTGDQSLTKQQISETQVIVTTPEKWDIITRKAGERAYTQLVRLVIIDEIHLLHDDRGPVLESIVARTIRQIESTQEMIRLVGLSATLPNYEDVARFLRVKPENLFPFANSFRPIPLEQTFIGLTVKKPFKRYQLMNEICYEKVMEQAGKNQVLVFVHSRKETAKTAKTLRDMALANNTLGKFLKEDAPSREILMTEAEEAKDPDLKDLLPYGFAIHHAGLTRADRTLVEDLFKDKHIQLLVSTSTLAWGVNLPAHTVIIKGTQIYNPEKGKWTELSPMDILQMLGRAGRPQYDKRGEGVVITGHAELQYYLSLLNQQLPIESQFISRLADNLNAEIVLGTVQNVKEAVTWLGYTYLYVRMLRAPTLYGVPADQIERDRLLEQRRYDLIHSAATLLAKNNIIKYDRKSGNFQVTDLGRIASHYYVSHHSMATYNEYLRSTTTDIELLRIFSLSNEFKYLVVRPDERFELEKLLERVPIPIKESIEEPSAKINVLLQAYISKLRLDGFSLASDMVYVTQSAARIMRALFEISLKRGWAQVAERCLNYSKMIDRRMWSTQSPLRQFKTLPEEIIKKLEKKDSSLDRLYALNSQELGELVHYPSLGKSLYQHIHQFPKLDLTATVQPITRLLLRVELTITPDFEYVEKVHGPSMMWWVFVEDVDGDNILHYEPFVLKQKFAKDDHYLTFTVPLSEPLPPQYFIKVISDRWLGAESILPISFRNLILPEKYPPHTDLLDLQPLPVAALKNSAFENLYKNLGLTYFNPIQTQVFNTLYNTDLNSLICAPTGSGKTICAEFAMLREFAREKPGKIVYVAPFPSLTKDRFADWNERFGKELQKKVVHLTGESAVDLKLMEKGDIIIATPEQWDMMSRRWRQRKIVQSIKLFIIDELHLLGSLIGPTIEIIVSRMRYIAHQLKVTQQKQAEQQQQQQGSGKTKIENPLRIIGLSTSLANAVDLGEWIAATTHSLFNFHPNVRPVPLEIHLQGFDNPQFSARILSMSRPLLSALSNYAGNKPVIIFVPSRKLGREVAADIIHWLRAEGTPKRFVHCTESDLKPSINQMKSKGLQEALSYGIAFYSERLNEQECDIVMQLFKAGHIQVIVATHSMCWTMDTLHAHLVVIMGTQYYEGKEHRYVDYPISDVLQMVGRAGRPKLDDSAKCILFCYSPKKEFYKKFIFEPLPIESHLDHYLHDHLNAEIVTRTIENKQDAVDYITWTFYYRRLTQNPNYYNLQGVTRSHLSDHLSELIEETVHDLEQSKCVGVEDKEGLVPLNLGMVAAYYYIKYTTIELFNFSLSAKTKMRGLIEILCNATEFEALPIRHKEDKIIEKLAHHLPVKINKPDWNSPATKANVLLQCYLSRRELSTDLYHDQRFVVEQAPKLLQAIVDVISTSEWLTPALAAMELSQMVTQAMWDTDSVFKQLPHFTDELINKLKSEAPEVETIFDFTEMDNEKRKHILKGLSNKQILEIAKVCNRYPNIEVTHQVLNADNIESGTGNVVVSVQLEREMSEPELSPVHSLYFPKKDKVEGWWVLIGDTQNNHLLAIKKISFVRTHSLKLEFATPTSPGTYRYTLYFMSDSWVGCDQEYEFEVRVKEKTEESQSS